MIIIEALCGLKSSGLRWSERLAVVLRELGFFPCFADLSVWMRDMKDHHEHAGACVDDLEIASRAPLLIIKALEGTCKFKLKGAGPVEHHLGCDFSRDEDGMLCQSPEKHLDRVFAKRAGVRRKA